MSESIDKNRRRLLGVAAAAVASAKLGLYDAMASPISSIMHPMTNGELASLSRANEWINSPPLTAAGLKGKVVLIDVWTYTCINWLRTLPYVRAWAAKYEKHGLVVIGVHAPEFPFEHDIENVRRAVKDMNVDYPVAIDNDFSIWRAFDNSYWPALYLIDATGRIRYRHFGEGASDQSERNIQRLLKNAGARGVDSDVVSVMGQGAEADADWSSLRSGENYVGYGRTEGFSSPGRAHVDERHVYLAPERLGLNQWALAGDWTLTQGSTLLNVPNGTIVYAFHARDLHLVMGPAARGTSIPFRVRLDGQPPGAAHGVDVDAQGTGMLSEQRMYQLIRQSTPIVDRRFEIEFLGAGAEAFSFTFG